MEAQVDAHSSAALEEEFKQAEAAKLDALVSRLRKEWLAEKESLLTIISQKEVKIEGSGLDLARLERKRKAAVPQRQPFWLADSSSEFL